MQAGTRITPKNVNIRLIYRQQQVAQVICSTFKNNHNYLIILTSFSKQNIVNKKAVFLIVLKPSIMSPIVSYAYISDDAT